MALGRDEHDIMDIFLIQNLANIANNSQFISAPSGFMQFIDVTTYNNVRQLGFPSDLNQLLVNYILINQTGDVPSVGQTTSNTTLKRRPLIL